LPLCAPACALDPYAQMKYQILEAMMAPNFSGYLMYAGKDIDLGDMKYMGQANTLMRRFEEIILKGKSIKPIEINEWSGIRIKKLDSKGLILVSDYSTYEPEEKVVQFSSKELFEKTLVDAQTGEKVEPLLGIYNVKIRQTAPAFSNSAQTKCGEGRQFFQPFLFLSDFILKSTSKSSLTKIFSDILQSMTL
jgi:hypothetical protein